MWPVVALQGTLSYYIDLWRALCSPAVCTSIDRTTRLAIGSCCCRHNLSPIQLGLVLTCSTTCARVWSPWCRIGWFTDFSGFVCSTQSCLFQVVFTTLVGFMHVFRIVSESVLHEQYAYDIPVFFLACRVCTELFPHNVHDLLLWRNLLFQWVELSSD